MMGKIDFTDIDVVSTIIHAIAPQLIEWEQRVDWILGEQRRFNQSVFLAADDTSRI